MVFVVMIAVLDVMGLLVVIVILVRRRHCDPCRLATKHAVYMLL